MTFYEARLSLQVLAEERVGASRYRAAIEARRTEDAIFGAAVGKAN